MTSEMRQKAKNFENLRNSRKNRKKELEIEKEREKRERERESKRDRLIDKRRPSEIGRREQSNSRGWC